MYCSYQYILKIMFEIAILQKAIILWQLLASYDDYNDMFLHWLLAQADAVFGSSCIVRSLKLG